MRVSFLRAVPALAAALILSVLPCCASLPDGFAEAAALQARENARADVNCQLKPLADGVPTGIRRGAGMDWHPPDLGADAELALVFFFVYAVIYVGYGIGWSFVKLGELIYEAFDSPEEEVAPEQTDADSGAPDDSS